MKPRAVSRPPTPWPPSIEELEATAHSDLASVSDCIRLFGSIRWMITEIKDLRQQLALAEIRAEADLKDLRAELRSASRSAPVTEPVDPRQLSLIE